MMIVSCALSMTRTPADDDLLEHRARNILSGLGVGDHEILVFLHHGGEVAETQIRCGHGIVEPLLGVALDRNWWIGERHVGCWCLSPAGSIALFVARKPPFYRARKVMAAGQ